MTQRRSVALQQRVRDRARAVATETYQDEILGAAERVFAERGFAATKISDIARAAGLATGTLYNYFDSKDQILGRLMLRRGDELLASMLAVGTAGEPLARLEAVVTAVLEHMDTHRATFRIFEEMSAGSECDIRRVGGEEMERQHGRYREVVAAIVRDGVAKGALRKLAIDDHVELLTGIMKGFIRSWMSAKTRGNAAQRAATIIDLFLHGVAR